MSHSHAIAPTPPIPRSSVLAKEIGGGGEELRRALQDAGRQSAERPQRHVSGLRGDPRCQGQGAHLKPDEKATLTAFKKELDGATKFIPTWVKVGVAIALGLGTMIGWKRIVVTVGEKIGKTHLTYGQGAAAELIAAATIGAADGFGLPVSTTHVLSSGVAGTMAANGSGLQWGTLRNIALAWVLTLPAAMILSGVLYALFRNLF